jgi:cobalt-zinc-cadmium efflux system protein
MYKGQKESLNIRGSFWHVMNAFLGSIAVIIAATFISLWEIYVADAWAGILFAVILIWAAYGIIRDSFMILVDATPKEIDLIQVERELLAIPGVVNAHHFHARTIAGHTKTFSGHLVVRDFGDAESVLREAKQILDEKYRFSLSTIQVEDERIAEADARELEYEARDERDTTSS